MIPISQRIKKGMIAYFSSGYSFSFSDSNEYSDKEKQFIEEIVEVISEKIIEKHGLFVADLDNDEIVPLNEHEVSDLILEAIQSIQTDT